MKSAVIKIFVPRRQSVGTAGVKNSALFAFGFSLLIFCFCLDVPAQEEQYQQTEPPPLKIVSKAEKSLLAAEADISDRTKLSLTLMENRLKKAENYYAAESFGDMFGELGGFNALIDEALGFLNRRDDGRGKVLNNFKRLEINLRRFIPRIELIRRELPARYEPYVRRLIKTVRAARSKAVEPLFDNSVVPSERTGNQDDIQNP